jgi:DNA-binding response OmpR family regulator
MANNPIIMKILIIEDQEKLAKLLRKGLKREGYAADYLTDGEAGQKRIELHHGNYDLIILDLMLPNRSGYEICKSVREQGIQTPVLVLTAKDNLEDKISLFDVGADDYLVKPFQFKEVLARIRALTRRPKNVLPLSLQIGDLILNPATRKVFRGQSEIKLTLKEFRLLEYLMSRPNRVVEREDIISNIWDFDFDSFSNVVDVYINRLRKKIENGVNKLSIETIRGVGYKIIN